MGSYHRTSEWQKVRSSYLSTQREYTCTGCGKPDLAGMDLHVDHIVPGHKGNGEFDYNNDFDNLTILCSECNGRKKDRVATGMKRVDWKSTEWF